MRSRFLAVSVVLLCLPGLGAHTGSDRAPAQSPPAAHPRLEVIEDLSESLANDVLDLSVAWSSCGLETASRPQ